MKEILVLFFEARAYVTTDSGLPSCIFTPLPSTCNSRRDMRFHSDSAEVRELFGQSNGERASERGRTCSLDVFIGAAPLVVEFLNHRCDVHEWS